MNEELNFKERRVLEVLRKTVGANDTPTIRDLARKCFPGYRPFEKADRAVRNGLRRLIRDRLVKRTGRGSYSPSTKGA